MTNPEEKYKALQNVNQDALSSDNLLSCIENNQAWINPKAQSFIEPKTTPSELVQQTLKQDGYGCIDAWTATDVKKPIQFVLNLRFANEDKASEFKKMHRETKIITSADKKTLTLTQEAIPEILGKLGITHYGTSSPVPMNEALQQQHRKETTLNTSISFFSTPEKRNHVRQLIETLTERPEASTSYFHKSLIEFLGKLPLTDASQLISKIKGFTREISAHASEEKATTQLLVDLILNPETKNPCDLIDKLNEIPTQNLTSSRS